jgi:hypothetical protein
MIISVTRDDMLTNSQKQVLKKIIGVFQKNQIVFQVTGGLAAIAYGSKRPLYDIDLDVYAKDIGKIKELFRPYLIKDLFHKQNEYWDIYLMTFNIEGVPVDITQLENWYYFDKAGEKKLMAARPENATLIEIEGIKVLVVAKEVLVAYKQAVSRPTDLADLSQILITK